MQEVKSELFVSGVAVLKTIVYHVINSSGVDKAIESPVRDTIVRCIGGLEPLTFLYPTNTERAFAKLFAHPKSKDWLLSAYSRVRLTAYAEPGRWEALVESMANTYGVSSPGDKTSLIGKSVTELPTKEEVRNRLKSDPCFAIICMLGSIDISITKDAKG